MVAVYFSLDAAGYKYSFRILSKRNVPDHESQESGFDPLNPSSEWIQRIQNPFGNSGKETQNPFWDLKIQIQILPKNRTLKCIS